MERMKTFISGLKNAVLGQPKNPNITIPVRPLSPSAELTDEQRATIQRKNFIASDIAEPSIMKVEETKKKE